MPAQSWLTLLTAVRDIIVDLRLPEIASTSVLIQQVACDRPRDGVPVTLPGILIAPHAAERLDPAAGTNLHADVVYPIAVSVLAAADADQPDRLELFTCWRARLCSAFHLRRLPQAGCYRVEVEPRPLVDRTLWLERLIGNSGLILHCFTRELRIG